MPLMTKDVLTTATHELLGGDPAGFTSERLQHLITLAQHAHDLLLNEIERRGELTFHEGMPVVPYISDHSVDTILTRGDPEDV